MRSVPKQTLEVLAKLRFTWDDQLKRHVPPSQFNNFFTVGTSIAYVGDDDIRRVLAVAKKIGSKEVFYVADEIFENEDLSEVDKIFSVDEASQLIEHHRSRGLEFYLIAEDKNWLVWAFHEPCMHIASKNEFVETFKSMYPNSPVCNPEWDDCLRKWEKSSSL